MSDVRKQIIDLQNQAADNELLGSLAADPEQRAESRRRAEEFDRQARNLRDGRAADAAFLHYQAARCRQLAGEQSDTTVSAELLRLAAEFDAIAGGDSAA